VEINRKIARMKIGNNRCLTKNINQFSVAVFFCLVLLVPSSISITHLPRTHDAYAQQQETTASAATSDPTTTTAPNPTTPVLPQSLRVSDIVMGDAQLPLRASIIDNKAVGELANAGQEKGKLGEYFPVVVFHFDKKPVGFGEGSTIVKHVLIGPIKSYDSADGVLGEANYWKDIPLDKKVALETDRSGLHYFIASVQFENGTSGIYSGIMEANAIGIKPSSDESIQFQLGPGNTASGVVKMDQSDMKASESDPIFQQIASGIICSDLNNNGFEVCEAGEEEQVLEENDSEEASRDDDDDSDDAGEGDEVEVRGDGGEGGRYDINNCTGEQCEDADRESEEEEDGDYCEIDPGYCEDKNKGNGNDDNGNDDNDNTNGDNDNENEDNSNEEDGGNDDKESGDEEENANANA
jgi:hypothetical protein